MVKSLKQKKHLEELNKNRDYSNNGRPEGSKNKETIIEEEAIEEVKSNYRERYINKIDPHFDEITDINIEQAKIPKNSKEREGVIEQLIDKPKQRSEVDVNIDKLEDLSNSIKEILEK